MAHADDELLSALLDGEPAPGDAAHVEGCEVCQARMSTLRYASTAVATPVTPPSPHLREAALSAALNATDGPRRVATAPRRMNALSAAAVLVVALAVGGLAISQLGNGGSDNLNSNTALRSGAEADAAGAATPTAGLGAAGSTMMAKAPYNAGDLGAFNDLNAVSQRAAADLEKSPEEIAAKSTGDASPCPYEDGYVPVWQATLTYNGEAAVAHLVRGADDKAVMRILRRAGCSVIATQESAPTTQR